MAFQAAAEFEEACLLERNRTLLRPASQGRTLLLIAPRCTQRHEQLQKLGQLMSSDGCRTQICEMESV